MKKLLFFILTATLFTANSFGTANDIYHERTSNTIGSCGVYVDNLSPTSANTVTLGFKIANQGFTNQARIYYTIDGTNPSGAFGVPGGTTLMLTASYACTFTDVNGNYDVVNATIPAYPTGTVIKYIISAWHQGGGLEIFGNGGSATSSGAATIFSYTVSASVLPLTLVNFSGKKGKDNVQLNWMTEQEINTDRFEIYQSTNSIQFKTIGTVTAKGIAGRSTQYAFTDINPAKGSNFYKLKIIDKDGKFYYSHVIKINFDTKNSVSIKATGKEVHIQLFSAEKDNYSVILLNDLGQSLKSWNVNDDGSSADHTLNLPDNLTKNVYHIAIKGSTNAYAQSIVIN